MSVRYFAYGSNLWVPRLSGRVPGIVVLGRARLAGYQLRWFKRGRDGSGKCSVDAAGARSEAVRGVLYSMPAGGRARLDAVEGVGRGYESIEVEVEAAWGTEIAYSYIAEAQYVDESLRPFHWYKQLVLAGAQLHGLLDRYVARLRDVQSVPDPDARRARRNRRGLPGSGEA